MGIYVFSSFLGVITVITQVITHIFRLKTFFFHGFGVEREIENGQIYSDLTGEMTPILVANRKGNGTPAISGKF